jgi:biotin operon repressor
MQGTGGAVIPFERGGAPAVSREEYVEAIHLWRQTRATAEVLSREEIGAMQWRERMDAQRKGLILALVEYYRNHERADVAPGVLAVITIMSDNDKGSAPISQHTLAKLFGRSRSSIAEAQDRLKKDGLIIGGGRGRYSQPSPVIPRAVTTGYNHVTWLISALCAPEASSNCPAAQDNYQLSGQTLQLDQSSGGTLQLEPVNCPVEDVSIVRPAPTQILSKNSTTLNRAASVVAAGIATALGSLPVAAQPPEPPVITQPAKLSLSEMTDRMMDAAGPALANPAAHSGLLTFGELQRWLAANCDFEGDILPAIRARAARAKPASLKSWSYFADAVADQKAIRERPMPEGRAPPGRFKSYADQEAERIQKFIDACGSSSSG